MSYFQTRFLKVLNEEEGLDDASREGDQQAFNASLDDGTDPQDFDVPANPMADYEAKQNANTISVLSTWVTNVEGFIEQLNGLSPNSMNAQLNSTDCGSILSDVARSESKKISRIAQDLSSLGEALKQYLLTAQNKDSRKDNI